MSSDQIIGDGKWLRLLNRDGWEIVTRKNISGIAVIITITTDNEILFIEQHRPPVGRKVLELPAGLCGDTSDTERIETAAKRELFEETGYVSERIIKIFDSPSSPGMSDEIITFFAAYDARQEGDGGGDEHEDITVYAIPIVEAHDWLMQQIKEGKLVDSKVFTALHFAL